jgi:hypothetical protein
MLIPGVKTQFYYYGKRVRSLVAVVSGVLYCRNSISEPRVIFLEVTHPQHYVHFTTFSSFSTVLFL